MKRKLLLLIAIMTLVAFTGCRADSPGGGVYIGPELEVTQLEPELVDGEEILPEMPTPAFMRFTGTITEISPFYEWVEGADMPVADTVLVNVANETTSTNFIVGPETVLVMDGELEAGAEVTGFYDASLFAAMIYPPQFAAVALTDRDHGVMVDRFDEALVSYDRTLKINLSAGTVITLQDGTMFYEPSAESLANRAMVIVYDISTRSIPAQATPERIIVLFERAEHPMLFLTEDELVGLE